MKKVGQIFREGITNRIKEDVEANSGVFLLSYSQVSSTQLGEFRKILCSSGATMNAVKNSIIRIALKDLEYSDLAEKVKDQTALIYTDGEASEIAKTLVKFEEDCEGVFVQGGILDKRVLDRNDVKQLSDLPSKDVLRMMLLGTIQAPITRFMGALNAKSRDLLSILKQLGDKKS